MPAGPGALDANGVYQYGEDDSAGPLFSDFLDLAPASISAQLGIRKRRTYSWANAVARAGQAGMVANDYGYQRDTGWSYVYDGAAWKVNGTPWQALPLAGAWVANGGVTGTPQFRMNGGEVEVMGCVKGGAATAGTIIATLPAGYRPLATRRYFGFANAAATVIDIQSNGNLVLPVAVASSSGVWLDSVRFLAEQ